MGGTWRAPRGWRKTREAVFKRDGRRCWCGAVATHIDHVIPRILGGPDDLGNLRPSCAHHNLSSGASIGNALRGSRLIVARQPFRTSRRW